MYFQIHQAMRELDTKLNDEPGSYDGIHQSLLSGLLSHIGMKDQEKNEYQGARNARFHIFLRLAYLRSSLSGLCLLSWWKPQNFGVV